MSPRFTRALLSLSIAHVIGFAGVTGAVTPALAVNVTASQSGGVLAGGRDLMRESVELKNAVLESPEDAELRYRLGRLNLDLGDIRAAEKELERAIDLGRNTYETWLALGEVWLAQGDFTRLFTDYQLLRADTPAERAGLLALQGNGRLVQGKYDEALELFDSALDQQGDFAPALEGIVEVRLAQGELGAAESALVRLGQAAGADPVEGLRLRANLAFKHGRIGEAESLYREAIERRGSDPILLRGLALTEIRLDKLDEADETLAQALSIQPGSVDLLYLQSLAAYRAKDFPRAADLAGALTDAEGHGVAALLVAGASSYQLGALQQAREYLARYVPIRPDDAAARQMLADVLMRTGDGDQAYQVLEPLGATADGDGALLDMLGTAAVMSGVIAEGIQYLERAVVLAPDDTALQARLAAARLAGGDRAKGIAELERLAAEDDAFAGAHLLLAQEHLAKGELDDAVAAAERFAANEPASPEAMMVEGLARMRMGQLDAAEALFQRALEARPGDADAQNGLAEVMLRRGDAQGALQRLQALYEGQPDNVMGQVNLAAVEMKAGREAQALDRLRRAVSNHPEVVGARAALARALIAGVHLAEARQVLAEAPDPAAPPLMLASAMADLAAAEPAEALATLQDLVAADPGEIEAWTLLARAQAELDDADGARETLRQVSGMAPADPLMLAEQARLTLLSPDSSDEELQAALRDVVELARLRGLSNPSVVLYRGLGALRVDGRAAEGLSLLRQANAALRSSDSALFLARALAQQGQAAAGVQVLDNWLSTHDQDVRALSARAKMRVAAGDYAGASDDLKALVELDPEASDLRLALAWTQALGGETELAEASLKSAPVDRDSGMALHARALIAADKGSPAQAVALLQQAANGSMSGLPRLRLDLARALAASGQAGLARAELQRLLNEMPAFPERPQALALQAQLGR